jgi:hypothetical protein
MIKYGSIDNQYLVQVFKDDLPYNVLKGLDYDGNYIELKIEWTTRYGDKEIRVWFDSELVMERKYPIDYNCRLFDSLEEVLRTRSDDEKEEEEEEKDECCGKHCDETNGLKLGKGYNRYHYNDEDMITEQLFCEICFEDYTTDTCRACSEKLPFSEMEYREGGDFGESDYCYNQFFCKGCIKDINSRSRVDY